MERFGRLAEDIGSRLDIATQRLTTRGRHIHWPHEPALTDGYRGRGDHIPASGIERRTMFEDRRDHEDFLELLAPLPQRYGLEVHAHILIKAEPAGDAASKEQPAQWELAQCVPLEQRISMAKRMKVERRETF